MPMWQLTFNVNDPEAGVAQKRNDLAAYTCAFVSLSTVESPWTKHSITLAVVILASVTAWLKRSMDS